MSIILRKLFPAAVFVLLITAYSVRSETSQIIITGSRAYLEDITLFNGPDSVVANPVVAVGDFSDTVLTVSISGIPQGMYDKISVKVMGLPPTITDSDLKTGDSFIILGTYNGTAFAYRTSTASIRTVRFASPIAVSSEGVLTFKLPLNLHSIFYDKGVELDPRNKENESIIDRNLRMAVAKAFID